LVATRRRGPPEERHVAARVVPAALGVKGNARVERSGAGSLPRTSPGLDAGLKTGQDSGCDLRVVVRALSVCAMVWPSVRGSGKRCGNQRKDQRDDQQDRRACQEEEGAAVLVAGEGDEEEDVQ